MCPIEYNEFRVLFIRINEFDPYYLFSVIKFSIILENQTQHSANGCMKNKKTSVKILTKFKKNEKFNQIQKSITILRC